MVDGDELEQLNREQLVLKARVLGVERPELMTRVELRDEIVRRAEPDLAKQKRARGFLGVARDLVASVVEAGLNLPDAAALIRGDGTRESDWKGPPPVATVTLAEIYATQGHLERALKMLDEVLNKEPDHDAARSLRDRLAAGVDVPRATPRKQRISFAEPEPVVVAPEPEPEPVVAPEPEPVVVAPEPEPVVFAPEPEPVVAAPEPEPVVAAPAVAEPPIPPAIVTLSLANQRQVYWELPPALLERLGQHAPGGRAVVRVLSFRTRAGKVEKSTRDYLIGQAAAGSAVLEGLRGDAIVRAALGWEANGTFRAFLVASDASAAPGSPRTPYRANARVFAVPAGIEERAARHLARRSSL